MILKIIPATRDVSPTQEVQQPDKGKHNRAEDRR